MRESDRQTAKLFSYVSPDGLVPQTHPLRPIRALVNAALGRLSADFAAIYSGQRPKPIAAAMGTSWDVGILS